MSRVTEHAEHWAQGITSDTDVAISLYTDDVRYDGHSAAGQERGPAADVAGLRERFAAYPDRETDNDPEAPRFEVLEAITTTGGSGSRSVTVLWHQNGEQRAGYQNPSTGDENPSVRDQTWWLADADGRIDREPTTWNDAPVFQRIGPPVPTPHSWEKDADPGSPV
ncbi:hypothetical protein [Protofrankia coriariae]|uniref:SnoaL-like domain-containing protein n=1 Tax=Protofrankia coriariae TaxID=1562887 RepID=A0ABR5F3F7_9ACTN|nr:hypothetical protein [Protofrankia coriariae]KLL11180.1 hypothetical protein FrCorBMG51_13170 [Protofrankia coriariae]